MSQDPATVALPAAARTDAFAANLISGGYVGRAGAQIHYRAAGDGPVVICLHQAPGSSAMWTQLLPQLAARGRRAIAFDLPGYGLSDPLPGAPDLAAYAGSIAMATHALGCEAFDIVGHHTGSSVALWLATGGQVRVRRMVMYGLPLLDPAAAQSLANEPAPAYDAEGREVTTWWQRCAPYLPQEQIETLLPRYTADMLRSGTGRPVAHHAVGWGDHAGRLAQLQIPTLAVQGRRDVLFAATEAAARHSPHVEFRAFGDAGIFVADEAPGAFADLIDTFLRG